MARLYGLTGADQIARSHVLIVGIGGVGSWIAEALARSGVGEMTLVDMDHIAESNINSSASSLMPITAVLDACDQVKAKVAMADWAIRQKVFMVTLGAAGGKKEAHRVEQADLSQVTHDPLLSQLRYRLRKEKGAPKEGKKIGVLCVFSRENVAPPDASCLIEGDGTLNCHGYGSAVTVTASFGLVAASLVVNYLATGLAKPKI